MTEKTPKSMRLQIGLFGRTNVGKSSFLNFVAGQDVALTSEQPGTTTDVVEKAMELLPLGPVVFLDTGGLDDVTTLAAKRLERTHKVFGRADAVVLLTEPNVWTDFEEDVITQAGMHETPCVIVINKIDWGTLDDAFLEILESKSRYITTCSAIAHDERDRYLGPFKTALARAVPDSVLESPPLVGDLLPPGGLAVLIVPIDLEAPKGRLILPQVQTIRDALDNDAATLVVKEREYPALLQRLGSPPDLVICDSQVVMKMVADTPKDVPCTTFSILFARYKGDLNEAARGAASVASLQPGDKVLIAEACSHHPLQDDIGRVKLPRWLRQYCGMDVDIDVYAGRDYPDDLEQYAVVIHCGACMLTRREMLHRTERARAAGVPVTNYGVCISLLHGVLERVLTPFPAALDAFKEATKKKERTVV
jgi:[FeFe] hydrogenase H-cluster maturation GTPase HydF